MQLLFQVTANDVQLCDLVIILTNLPKIASAYKNSQTSVSTEIPNNFSKIVTERQRNS